MVARPVRSVTLPIKSISPQGSLLETLRQYRTDQAYLRAVPQSAVFSNKLLTGIVTARPSTIVSLLKLRGIGPTRCQNYGRDIVRFVNLDSKGRGKLPARKPGGKKIKKINGSKAKSIKPPKIVTSRFFPLPSVPFQPAFEPAFQQIQPLVPLLPKAQRIIPNLKLKTSVYVLELEDGRVYVGSSTNVPRRLSQHTAGSGAAYTRLYKPTGVQLPRLGNIEGDGDAAERDETLRYMMIRGIPFVRGWKFARVDMPPEEFNEAEANIRELFDLCRKCGYKGHFCTHCRATFDRLGNPVGRC